ncbi:MAG: hypothetical protein CVT92_04725 [Bacteroidetes bacterium HGW-Bacteroidetes-1]|jgi:hypothetical protein|nr:MAG: hypothetical protein CVT92_04725 [Bacteroidetes bacterium HGW-Bacteroidetes-1]
MKTQSIITAILISVIFQTTIFADNFKMKDEKYIDDIPFNTVEIFNKYMLSDTSFTQKMDQETYVPDIPFDTQKIASDQLSEEATAQTFKLEEEAYIPDIPFNTREISYKTRNIATHSSSTAILRYLLVIKK